MPVYPSSSIFARNRMLGQMAFAEHRDMQLSGSGEPMRVFTARVTDSFFPLLVGECIAGPDVSY
jgi:hypothetical protein